MISIAKRLQPLYPYLWRYRRRYLIGFGALLCDVAFWLAIPMIIKYAIDDLQQGATADKLLLYIRWLVLAALGKAFFLFWKRIILVGISREAEYDLRNDLYRHLNRLSLTYFQRNRTGDIMSRATNDMNAVRMLLGPGIMYSLNTFVTLLAALAIMLSISPKLTFYCFLLMPVVVGVVVFFGRRIHERFESIQAILSTLSAKVQESLAGIRVVRAYAQEEAEIARFQEANEEYVAQNMKLVRLWGMFYPSLEVLLIESSPLNLDPRIGTDAQSQRIGALIFDSLLRSDRNFRLQPWLAESWESPDPLTYVFHLRKDVRFHDGRPLTARDVRYTFTSLLSGAIPSIKAASFAQIDSIETSDDATVVIRLKEPYASFPWNLTQGAIGIVPEGSLQEVALDPIGSGPFRFVSATQDDEVLLERNPDYWATPPQIARVRFKVVPDATVRALEMRKGSADLLLNSLSADMVEVLRQEESLEVVQQPGTNYQYLAFNMENKDLTLPVRQAIAQGIDRQALITYLWRDTVRPANSILPPQHWAYEKDAPAYPYDPSKARALLDAEGLAPGPDGVRLRLQMKTSTDQTTRELAAVFQEQLRQIGIALEIRSFEWATFYGDVVRGRFDFYSLRWTGANNDPDIFEYCFHSAKQPPAGANRGRYSNPAADRLIEQGRASSDMEERRQHYSELQKVLNHDLPYIHLWYMNNVSLYNRRLSNLELFPTGNYQFLTTLRIASP